MMRDAILHNKRLTLRRAGLTKTSANAIAQLSVVGDAIVSRCTHVLKDAILPMNASEQHTTVQQ